MSFCSPLACVVVNGDESVTSLMDELAGLMVRPFSSLAHMICMSF